MPRIRETPKQRADKLFRSYISAGLVRTEMTRTQLAAALGIAPRTLASYQAKPDKIPFEKIRTLCRLGVLEETDLRQITFY